MNGRIQLDEFPQSRALNRTPFPRLFLDPKFLGLFVSKGLNHEEYES